MRIKQCLTGPRMAKKQTLKSFNIPVREKSMQQGGGCRWLLHILIMLSIFVCVVSGDLVYDNKVSQVAKSFIHPDNLSENIRIQHPGTYKLLQRHKEVEKSLAEIQYKAVSANMTPMFNQSLVSEQTILQKHLQNPGHALQQNINYYSSQQFFTQKEILTYETIITHIEIEDVLLSRIWALARLTCKVVYEDFGLKTDDAPNIRNNPQYNQLRSFMKLEKKSDFSKKDLVKILGTKILPISAELGNQSMQVEGSDIIIGGTIDITSPEWNEMSKFFQTLILWPQVLEVLFKGLDFHVTPMAGKNTTFYYDRRQEEEAVDSIPEARVSYKFYLQRYPDLIEPSGFQDQQSLSYDNSSIHYKELHFFDDMIKKINDEKEVWPGVKLQDMGQKKGAAKTRDAEGKRAGFNPPFGSFQRDVLLGARAHSYPVQEIQVMEENRVLRQIVTLLALQHHRENFNTIKAYLGEAQVSNMDYISKLFFTYDDPKVVQRMTDGILPKNIDKLPLQSSHAKFFQKEVSIRAQQGTPGCGEKEKDNDWHQLSPKMHQIKIANTQSMKAGEYITISDILTSSPEITVSLPENVTLPVTLGPKQRVTVNIIITPNFLGKFSGMVYVLLSKRVFVHSFQMYTYPNKFGVTPLFSVQLAAQEEEVTQALVIANPYNKQIFIEEFYLTNDRFKADFKKIAGKKESKHMNFVIEANSNRTFSNLYFKPEAGTKFEETTVVIKFSTGEFLRVPYLVYQQHSLIATYPSLIDFGLVQLHQKPLMIKVKAFINASKVKKVLDILLPLDQPNLDFDIFPIREGHGYGIIVLGVVYLKPVKAQFIATSIKLKIQTYEDIGEINDVEQAEECVDGDKIMFVEIPIIGSVVNHTMLLASKDHYPEELVNTDQKEPKPLLHLNLNMEQIDQHEVRVKNGGMPYRMTSPLQITNNLSSALTIQQPLFSSSQQVWQSNDEFNSKIGVFYPVNGDITALMKLGVFNLPSNTTAHWGNHVTASGILPFRQGYQLIWLKIDQVLVPSVLSLAANNLYCQFQNSTTSRAAGEVDGELKVSGNFTRFSSPFMQIYPCQDQNATVGFGDIQAGVAKSKILKIININPMKIVLHSITKNLLDDMSITLSRITDKEGNTVAPTWVDLPASKTGENVEIISNKRSKRQIGLYLPPHHSVFLKLTVLCFHEKHKSNFFELKFMPEQYGKMHVHFGYAVHPGSLTFQPQIYKYQPAFQGMQQTKILTVKSNYSVPVELEKVRSTDPRIEARLLNKEVLPWNVSISGMITYDAGKTGMESHSDYIQAISQFSIDNPPTLQIDAFNLQKMQAKRSPGKYQSGAELYSKFQSLSDNEILQMIKNLEPYLTQEDGIIDNSLVNLNLKGNQNKGDNQTFFSIPLKDTFKSGFIAPQSNQTPPHLSHQKATSNKQNTGLFSAPDKDFKISDSLTYRDILAWRERSEEWKQLERHGKTTINSELEISTSFEDQISIPIQATLRRPQVHPASSLQFGALQIGDSLSRDIFLENPTTETIQVQLLVTYDLDSSFIASKTTNQAWTDKGAFKDKMLTQIEIYMKGVDLAYVSNVEYMFRELKGRNAPALDIDISKIPKKSKKDIIDILLRYSGKEEANPGSFDEILHYYIEFDKQMENNYVSKYCLQVFLEEGYIQEYESFRHFFTEVVNGDDTMMYFNQSIGWSEYVAKQRMFISEKENTVTQCLFAIKYVGLLEKEMYDQQSREAVSRTDRQYTIDTIQNYYRQLYLNVFDFDWKINNSMEKCNLTMPVEQLDNLTSVDDITQVLRSIFYHDTLQTWRRWQLASNRYRRSQLEAQATRTGPLAQFQERYIYYLSSVVPFTHSRFAQFQTREERKGYEANIGKLMKAQDWFSTGKSVLELSNPDQIQGVITQVWERDLQENIKKEEDMLKNTYGHKNYLVKMYHNLWNTAFSEIFELVSRFLAYDKNNYTNGLNDQDTCIVNPLSSIHDRYSLASPNLQRQMIKNNVNRKLLVSKKHDPSSESPNMPIQNFYLNPEYKEKVFDVPPGSNFTIRDAIIFEPQVIEQQFNEKLKAELDKLRETATDGSPLKTTLSLFEESMGNKEMRSTPMQLLIKNNLTIVEAVKLEGYGTSGLLEIYDIKKLQLEAPDEFSYGEPQPQYEYVSIGKTHTHRLTGMLNISQYSNLEAWLDQTPEKPRHQELNLTALIDDTEYSRKKNLFGIMAGTELHVTNFLFDEKTQEEWARTRDQPKPTYSITEQITKNNFLLKNYLRKNDRYRLGLEMQSFKNYIPFNIPITDIFMKQVKRAGSDSEGEQTLSTLFYIQQLELGYPEESFDPDDPPAQILEDRRNQKLEQQGLAKKYIRKMLGFLDKPSANSHRHLKQQIAMALHRWDNQDFRVDLNWTDFDYHVMRHKVHLRQDHVRHVLFINSGASPIHIKQISIDGTSNKRCTDFWEILQVVNCRQLVGAVVNPKQQVKIELKYHETFQFLNTQKTLTIETEHFTQKFHLDFQISEQAQALHSRLSSRYFWGMNLDERTSYFVRLCQWTFVLQLVYLAMLMTIIMRCVLDDQIMMVNKIFPILDPSKVKLEVKSEISYSDESLEMDFSTSVFCTLGGGGDIIGSRMSQLEICSSYLAINQKLNSVHDLDKDFGHLACHKHIRDVMPVLISSRKNVGFPLHVENKLEGTPIEKSAVYLNFMVNKSQFKEDSKKFVKEAISFQENKKLNIFKAQKEASILREKQKPKLTEIEEIELKIMKEMSLRSPEEAKNTRIRFYKDDNGVLGYSLLNVSEVDQDVPCRVLTIKPGQKQLKKVKQEKAKTQPIPEIPVETTAPVMSKKQKKQLLLQKQQEDAREKARIQETEKVKKQKEDEDVNKKLQLQKKECEANAEEKEKKVKVKKLTKVEQKKKDIRLKKEQELAESTLRVEQMLEAQKIREELVVEQGIKMQIIEEEEKQQVVQKEQELDIVDVDDLPSIQSYHSSEEKEKELQKTAEKKKDSFIEPKRQAYHQTNSQKRADTHAAITSKKAQPQVAQALLPTPHQDKKVANFWETFDKSLGIETDMRTNEQINDIVAVSPKQPQNERAFEFDSTSDVEELKSEDEKPIIIESDKTGDCSPESEKDEDDSHLPLFQQRKYIQKLQNVAFEEEEIEELQKKQQDKIVPDIQKVNIYRSQQAQEEETKDKNGRKVFEGKPMVQKLDNKEQTIRSKNPNADFNNPNNPNYKGRLATKIIDSYLPKSKSKVFKIEKELDESPDLREKRGRETQEEYFEERKNSRHQQYNQYYKEDSDDEHSRDYSYPEDPYAYKKYRRNEPVYEDEPLYNRDYRNSRERYPEDRDRERWGPTPPGDYYLPTRGGRGRARGRGRGYPLYEEEYQTTFGRGRGFQSKYKYPDEDDYYYEDTNATRYDKKSSRPAQEWSRDDDTRDDYKNKKGSTKRSVQEWNREDQYVEKKTAGYYNDREEDESYPEYKSKKVKPVKPLVTYEQKTTPPERVERGGRGERGMIKVRGSARDVYEPTTTYRGRGRGAYGATHEMYEFKVKEKDQSAHKDQSSKSSNDCLFEEKMKYVPKQNQSGKQPKELSLESQEIQNQEASITESEQEQPDYDMENLQNSIKQAMNQVKESDKKVQQKEENKSVYQTFMDVSSIFSRDFGNLKQKQKSRFVAEDEQMDEEDDQMDIQMPILRIPSQNTNEESIFSSTNLFSRSPRNPANSFPFNDQNMLYNAPNTSSIFGQNQNMDNQIGGFMPTHEQQQLPQSYIGNNVEDEIMMQLPPRSPQTGLSSSSFARLQQRAQDIDREDMMNQIQRQSQQESVMFQGMPSNKTSDQMFGSLGALPVPKFLKEKQNQLEKPEEDDDQTSDQIFGRKAPRYFSENLD